MAKTTIKAAIKKNRNTNEYEIHLHIDSPYEPGSEKHRELTEAVTAKLWAANFPGRDFDSNSVKLFLMNHTTHQYEEVDEKGVQEFFFNEDIVVPTKPPLIIPEQPEV